jgi:hypothetical protein
VEPVGKLAHLIKEQGPPVSPLQEPRFTALRTGKSALLMSEHFAFNIGRAIFAKQPERLPRSVVDLQ